MLRPIICIIVFSCSPIYSELLLAFSVSQPVKAHVHYLCSSWLYFSIENCSSIELSVCNGVGGCLCPISSKMIMVYTASLAMMYKAANSASFYDYITCLIMWAMLRTAPLFCGMVESLDRWKWPPALLRAFGLLR